MKCGDAADDAVPGMHLDVPVMLGVVALLLGLLAFTLL